MSDTDLAWDIEPWVKSSRERTKLELGLAYQAQKTRVQPTCKSPEYRETQRRFHAEMAALNLRGVPDG